MSTLMSTTDWPNVDANAVLPHLVSSADLFDGELFGDELIDIYNSSVVDGDGSGDDDIPHLLVPSDHDEEHANTDENHPGAQVAVTAAAIDDGLGAFRPSTSFNDLTTLLTSHGEAIEQGKEGSKNNASVAAESSAVAPLTIKTEEPTTDLHKPITKKRKSSVAESNSPKKKSAGSRSGRGKAATKKQCELPNPSGAKATVKSEPSDDKESCIEPPNPLSIETQPEVDLVPVTVPSTQFQTVSAISIPKRSVSTERFTSDSPTPSACSESEFKTIAQAAVSSLIQGASSKSDSTVSSSNESLAGDEKVDTSTEHIKALTGNNWVAACSGANVGVAVVQHITESKSANNNNNNNRARRQNLTPDERARQNRDRNREHARNTRLRKKAYVEELKRTLTELVAQRDAADFEKRQAAQRELEQREVRFRVIEEFLKLQGRNERSYARWAAILEDGFVLTLPSTPFRKMVSCNESKSEQIIDGVTNVMADSDHFAEFLQSLGRGDKSEPITLQYRCERKNFFMDGSCAMMEWEASSLGATKQGAESELKMKGILRGVFSPASNKLLSASISFDTGAILSQIRKNPILSRLNIDLCDDAAAAAAAAAQAAANSADALLDSLQMPRLAVTVPNAVTVVTPSSSGNETCDKGEVSCDESLTNESEHKANESAMRRAQRA